MQLSLVSARPTRRPARTLRRAEDSTGRWIATILALSAGLALPVTAAAQDFLFREPMINLTFRGGFNFARAGSDLFDFTMEQLTLEKSDFAAAALGADLGVRLTDRLDVFASFTHMATSQQSEFREWLDQDDLPITQRTRFVQTPLTLGLRYYLSARGRSVGRFVWIPEKLVPYVGAAGGVVHYEFMQEGSWVDFRDLAVFDDRFESDGLTAIAQALAGLDYTLGKRAVLNTEARLTVGSGELGDDYIGFDRLDLSGLQITLGLKFRF